jgi:hypothetical protein
MDNYSTHIQPEDKDSTLLRNFHALLPHISQESTCHNQANLLPRDKVTTDGVWIAVGLIRFFSNSCLPFTYHYRKRPMFSVAVFPSWYSLPTMGVPILRVSRPRRLTFHTNLLLVHLPHSCSLVVVVRVTPVLRVAL